jgi:pyrroloquinoline quinone (PQQ) biosynthesis protein C
MNVTTFVESIYAAETESFAATELFQRLENGAAESTDYDNFVANLCRTHLKSPQILAFLYSVAPPAAAETVKHNMLEEMGLEAAGVSHPALLNKLAAASGFDRTARQTLDKLAQEELRRIVSDPIMFGTMSEIGFNILLETTAFEWMLSRLASRIANFLIEHRGLSHESLEWFHHHSEVDIRHAAEGLETIAEYARFYEFESSDIEIIADVTFRENVFAKRYFGETALAANS